MEKQPGVEYISTDFAGEFAAQKKHDILQIDEPTNCFDLLICYHVLEHVEDDRKAMSELYRILKPGGKAIVQTPFKDGDIFEDTTIRTPEDRLKNFGQEDHVRVYSVQGLKKRLEQTGFGVEILSCTLVISETAGNSSSEIMLGMKTAESILVATKKSS